MPTIPSSNIVDSALRQNLDRSMNTDRGLCQRRATMPVDCGILISELETAVSSGGCERRVETLRRITDLFLQAADRYSSEQVALFDDVMVRLSGEIETRARAELSTRLAALANAPIKIVYSLAFDDIIDVAGPVLTQSPQITEEAILTIAQTKSQQHLLAISQRASINEATTDILIHRGDRDVVRSVASNDGARFSDSGIGQLADRASGDSVLATWLLQRKDIQSHHLHAAIARASQAIMNKMIAECPNLEANVRNVVAQAAEKFRSDLGARARDYSVAVKQIDTMQSAEVLNDPIVAEFAKAKNIESTIVALARLCDVPVDTVAHCLFNEQIDLLLILARAAGLSWVTTKWLLTLRDMELHGIKHDPDQAKSHFLKLHPVTAQRLLRFYRFRNLAPQSAQSH
jgi:uncharacterized protein (DUF2336 family)